MRILIMMTGGTISTTVSESGHLAANGKKTVSLLAAEYERRGGTDAEFEYRHPLDILSENMTFAHLDRLLDAFRGVERGRYDAIIVAHGTDTLAYTSSLLALALAGWWDKPVFVVSSDRTLTDPRANGYDNFCAAVELAKSGFGAGVYVPYRNSDGTVYLHHGAHLRQCGNFTSDFFSADMRPCSEAVPYHTDAEHPILDQLTHLSPCVMRIEPYVGIDYASYRMGKGIRAVLHGSYHSSTACALRDSVSGAYTSRSVHYLIKKCRAKGIDTFLSPLPESMRTTSGVYHTTADLIASGIQPIFSLTSECAYMKLVLAYSLGYEGEEVGLFVERQLADEKITFLE